MGCGLNSFGGGSGRAASGMPSSSRMRAPGSSPPARPGATVYPGLAPAVQCQDNSHLRDSNSSSSSNNTSNNKSTRRPDGHGADHLLELGGQVGARLEGVRDAGLGEGRESLSSRLAVGWHGSRRDSIHIAYSSERCDEWVRPGHVSYIDAQGCLSVTRFKVRPDGHTT